MSKLIEMTGKQFGQWTVSKASYPGAWECQCSCGTVAVVTGGNLRQGKSTQCYKCRGKLLGEINRKHGHSTRKEGLSTEYNSWKHMKDRCYREGNPFHKDYGKRDVTVCPEWIDNFQAFLNHIGPKPGPSYTVERIRNGGNYEPGNVKWGTKREQANNRRSNSIITIDGMSGTLRHLCDQLDLDYEFMRRRTQRVLSRRTPQEAANAHRVLKST
jgi:hypothetical protein